MRVRGGGDRGRVPCSVARDGYLSSINNVEHVLQRCVLLIYFVRSSSGISALKVNVFYRNLGTALSFEYGGRQRYEPHDQA